MHRTDHEPRTVPRGAGFGGARLCLAAVAALLLLGTTLRLLGYFGGIELWWDEAMWATFIAEGRAAVIRPPAYVWVSRWLLELRNTEPVIRSPSLIAGVLSLPVFVVLCRRAGLSRLATAFGLFILAVHPAAIDLTKEFKPYALELFLHLLLLWLAFSFLGSHRTWRVVLLGLTATAAAPFSWSVVVLYPGLFTAAAISALRRRHVAQIVAAVAGAATTLAAVAVAFTTHYKHSDPNVSYWGRKYDVFYLGSDLQGLASWVLEKTWEVASYPAHLQSFWLGPPVVVALWALQGAFCLLGVIAMATSRRWDRAALWVSPWAMTIGLNLLGWWPYGVFRTNLFLLAYSLLVGLSGLDGLRRWIAARPQATRLGGRWLVPAFCSLFVLVFLPLDPGHFAEGKSSGMAGNCFVHQAFEVVYEAERDEPPPAKPRRFLVDSHAYDTYLYYRDFHVVARARYQDFLRERYRRSRRYQPLKQAIDRQAGRGFWLLACHPGERSSLRQYVQKRCSRVDHVWSFPHDGVLLRCRGDAEPPR